MSPRIHLAKDYLYLAAGGLFLAVGVVLFLSPNRIVTGSTTLAIVLHHLLEIPLSLLVVLVNLPLLGLGLKVLGRAYTLRTVLAVLLSALLINVLNDWFLRSGIS